MQKEKELTEKFSQKVLKKIQNPKSEILISIHKRPVLRIS